MTTPILGNVTDFTVSCPSLQSRLSLLPESEFFSEMSNAWAHPSGSYLPLSCLTHLYCLLEDSLKPLPCLFCPSWFEMPVFNSWEPAVMPSHQEPLVSLVPVFLHFVVRDSGPPTCSPGAAAAKCSLGV